jgi:hypothetical protein
VGEMEAVIKKSEILVMDLIKILKEEAIKKGGLEGEVKRAKMHMFDKMVILEGAELEVAKLFREESLLSNQFS